MNNSFYLHAQRWLTALLLLTCHAFAMADPVYFFRVDDRLPDEIFANGFIPWGNNANLVDHLEGTSCMDFKPGSDGRPRAKSIYISLTQNPARSDPQASTRIEQRVKDGQPGRIWRYLVRPDQNTYDATRTMESTGLNLVTGRLHGVYMVALLGTEWVNRGTIPPERIRAAELLELVDGRVVRVANTYVENPRYVDVETVGNPEPLPTSVVDISSEGRYRAMIGLITMISACFCNSRNSVGPAPRSAMTRLEPVTVPGASCRNQVQFINDVIPQNRYIWFTPKAPSGWEL